MANDSDSRSDSRESVYKNPRPFRREQPWKGGRTKNIHKPAPKRKGKWEAERSMERGKDHQNRRQERWEAPKNQRSEKARRDKEDDELKDGREYHKREEQQQQIDALQGKVERLQRHIQQIEQEQGKSIPRQWEDGKDLRRDKRGNREEWDWMDEKSPTAAKLDRQREGSSTDKQENKWRTDEERTNKKMQTKRKNWEAPDARPGTIGERIKNKELRDWKKRKTEQKTCRKDPAKKH